MKFVLYSYVGFFTLFSVWSVWDSFNEKEPLRDIVIDALLYLATVTGMFLYALRVRNESLIQAWKVMSVVLVVAHLWVNLRDRTNVLSGRDKNFRAKAPAARAVLAADVVSALILVPALVINVLYGYF